MTEDTNMNISVNGQSRVPPGFRFHPTEEELLHYYLRKKVSLQKIDLDVIRDVDLNKLEPWDIQEKCRIGNSPQNDWYFFCHKDKKYPTGTRTNRATAAGFWKATGRDKIIYSHGKGIGMRKTLVFYKGRAPHGQKSDWIMHEYRLEDDVSDYKGLDHMSQEDGMVVCRVFKKKTNKALDRNSSSSSINTQDFVVVDHMANEGSLEQIFRDSTGSKVPSLASPTFGWGGSGYQPVVKESDSSMVGNPLAGTKPNEVYQEESTLTHWSAFDHLVAYHLNGPNDDAIFSEEHGMHFSNAKPSISSTSADQQHDSNVDLWQFSPRPFDPLHHVSNHRI